jgi:hypothetical protein
MVNVLFEFSVLNEKLVVPKLISGLAAFIDAIDALIFAEKSVLK